MEGVSEQPKKYIPLENSKSPTGLYEDVKNIWTPIQARVVSIQVAERKPDSEEKKDKIAEKVARLNLSLLTYKEYIKEKYSPEDVQTILENSNREKIAENDQLVAEYNEIASRNEITPEIAIDFMNKGLRIFKGE